MSLRRSHRRWVLGGVPGEGGAAVGSTAGVAMGRRKHEGCCGQRLGAHLLPAVGGKRSQGACGGAHTLA